MKHLVLLTSLLVGACTDSTIPDGFEPGDITDDGHFAQPLVYQNDGPASCTDVEYSCTTTVTLCPSGSANYRPGGDIIYNFPYELDGNALTLVAENPGDSIHFQFDGAHELVDLDGLVLTRIDPGSACLDLTQ